MNGLFQKLTFQRADRGEKLPDVLTDLDRQIAEREAAMKAKQQQLAEEAEALKAEEEERARLAIQRRFLAEQLTQADQREMLRPEFEAAHKQFTAIFAALNLLRKQVETAENEAAGLQQAYDILRKQNTTPGAAVQRFGQMLDRMQAAGMSAEEVNQYRREKGTLQDIRPASREEREADIRRRREAALEKLHALFAKIMKGEL